MSNEIFGLPQPLSGAELITIQQQQNGQLATCSMPLSDFVAYFAAWMAALSKDEPTAPGVVWNNAGAISVS